jgi:hypothetical protein
MNTRLLGRLSMLASAIMLVNGVRLVATGHPDTPGFLDLDTLSMVVQLVSAMGGLGCMLALIALNATGKNPIFRLPSYLPVVGYAALMVGFLIGLAGVPIRSNPIGIFGQLATQSGRLVLAILVIAAKSWTGWRRFAPLVTVLTIPLGAVLVGLTGLDGMFIIINAMAMILLGYAVQSSEPVPQLRAAVA